MTYACVKTPKEAWGKNSIWLCSTCSIDNRAGMTSKGDGLLRSNLPRGDTILPGDTIYTSGGKLLRDNSKGQTPKRDGGLL